MPNERIATCCYCGTRAALVLRGSDRHELACSNCGAPLHDLKMLPAKHEGRRELVKPSRVRTATPQDRKSKPERSRKKKKRKGLKHVIFEEAWDLLEDIFD